MGQLYTCSITYYQPELTAITLLALAEPALLPYHSLFFSFLSTSHHKYTHQDMVAWVWAAPRKRVPPLDQHPLIATAVGAQPYSQMPRIQRLLLT